MKLLTQANKKTLPKLYAQEHCENPIAHIKFFTPDAGWSWFVMEGKKEDTDYLFFGKVFSDLCPEGELGYFRLSELKTIKGGLGLPVERDLYFSPKPLSELTINA